MNVLRKRKDFILASKARRVATPGFVVQGRQRKTDQDGPRIGFTCSKKVGNAVARNRAKRRLRALARDCLLPLAQDGWDYVLVGRADVTAQRPMDQLCTDLHTALHRLHGGRK
jgi:ribonuclease P protein component